MNESTQGFIRGTSVPLPDGGDTHFHPWENGRGFTTTVCLPEVTFHEDIRFHEMFGQRSPPRPDVLRDMPW